MNASAALADDEEPDPLGSGGYFFNNTDIDNNNDDHHLPLSRPNATSPILSDGVGPTNASAVAKLLLLTLPEALPVTWLAGQQQQFPQQQQQQQLAYGPNEDGFFSGKTTTTSSIEFQAGHESTWSQLLGALFYNNSNVTSMNLQQYPDAAATSNAELEINWFNLILALVLVMLMLTTAIGNLFVIVAILIERNLRTIGNYLVLSLAIADLLVACLVMPLAGIYQILERWTLGVLLCDIWTSADVFCCTASILHLLAIALDRYWAVTRVDYIRCQRNERRILFMIFFVWMAALIISLAPIFGWKDADFESRITKERECLISQDVGYQIFATCTTFYFPLTLTLIFYWKIYQVARKRIRRKPGGRLANQKVSQPNPSTSSSNSAPPPPTAAQQPANQRSQQHNNDNHGNKHATTVRIPNENCACLCHHHQVTITGNGTQLKASLNSGQDLAAQMAGLKQAAEDDKCSSVVWPNRAELVENQKTQRQEINLDSTERKNGDNHRAAGGDPPRALQCQRQLKQTSGGTNSDKGQTGTEPHTGDNQILGLSNMNACPVVEPQTMEKDVNGSRLDYLHQPDRFMGSNGCESASCMNNTPNNIAVRDGGTGQSADGVDNKQSSSTVSLSPPTPMMKEVSAELAPELNGRGSSLLPTNNNGTNGDRRLSTSDQQQQQQQTINGGSKSNRPTEKVVGERDKERSSLLGSKRSSEVSTSTGCGVGVGGGGVGGSGIGAGSSSHTSSLVNYSAYSNDCQHLTSTASAGVATSAIINPSAGAPGPLMQSCGVAGGTNGSNLGGASGTGGGCVGGHLSTGCLDSLDDCCGCCCEPIPAAQSSNDLTTASVGQPSAIGGGELNQSIEQENKAIVIVQQQGRLVSSELASPPRGEPPIGPHEEPLAKAVNSDKRSTLISIIDQVGSFFGQVLELLGAKSNRKRLDNDGQLKGVLLVANEKGQQQASRLIGLGGTCTKCSCNTNIINSSYEQQTVRQPTTQLNHHSVHQNQNNNNNAPSQQKQQQQQQQQQLKGLSTQFQQQQQMKELAAEGLESKRERKAAKTLAIITGVFVICWLPFFVMAITMPLLNLKPHKYIFALLLWLGYVNSMLNPIIYTIFSPDFRKAFKRLLCAINGSAGAAGGQHETPARRAQRLNQQIQRQRVISGQAAATMRGDSFLDNNNNNNNTERSCWTSIRSKVCASGTGNDV